MKTLLAFLFATSSVAAEPGSVPLEIPIATDERLRVELYANTPDIMTPIGAAADSAGRLYVLESHTHLRPAGYVGPKRDRIKVFEGVGANGRAERIGIFADDILEGMNLAFAPDGTLYVITSKTVEALRDRDGDGKADEKQVVLKLDTEESYPHNQLLGLTIADGWLYASRGNTGGSWHAWIAASGERLEAYGDGGDIVRCHLDGTHLERVATGFWNPFDIKFDRHGRLIAIDNDPNSRGPNRLLHIVQGGDYGFKSLYGPSGLHPYNAWEGDLPGTLPMIAGIGESPAGVLDLSYTTLPADYCDTIAATIWAEHSVSLCRIKPAGASLKATVETLIRGGRWFRPVALTTTPAGTIFITDWVLKDYPNHGQGRIWRITAKPGIATMKPAPPASKIHLDVPIPNSGHALPNLRPFLKSDDPFVQHAARIQLEPTEARRALADSEPSVRLGGLLALRSAEVPDAESIVDPLLDDGDERVRQMALIWTGERQLRNLASRIDHAVAPHQISGRLFETWLATKQLLQAPLQPFDRTAIRGFSLKNTEDDPILEAVLADAERPAAVRLFALRRLMHPKPPLREVIRQLAERGEPSLQVDAIRTLAADPQPELSEWFCGIALDAKQPALVRAEAISAAGLGSASALERLQSDPDTNVRKQAARTLRREEDINRPNPSMAAPWEKLLASGGDPGAGERVFFAPRSMCSQCHRVDGRGAVVGPDLSVIARTSKREQIIRSIVTPSDEIAPQYQGWEVKTKDGQVYTGFQGHLRPDGGVSLLSPSGEELNVPGQRLASYHALENSIMPDGLAALFSVEELRDLVAFLESHQ